MPPRRVVFFLPFHYSHCSFPSHLRTKSSKIVPVEDDESVILLNKSSVHLLHALIETMAPSFHDEQRSLVDLQPPSSPASVPRDDLADEHAKKGLFKEGAVDLLPPSLYFGDSKPLSFNSLRKCQDQHASFNDELESLKARAERLTQCCANGSLSPVRRACSLSLRARVPLVLRQTEQQLAKSKDNAYGEGNPLGGMRSMLALVRATHFLDAVQEGMDPESNEGLDEQLSTVLAGLDAESLPEDFRRQLSFRVSPWTVSALCFDLALGPSAQWHTTPQEARRGGEQKLPIRVEVEPVVEFRAHDRASVAAARAAARACAVEIESCGHEARAVCTGAGMIGEATVRVRVRPAAARSSDRRAGVWGSDEEVQSLCIKEARA